MSRAPPSTTETVAPRSPLKDSATGSMSFPHAHETTGDIDPMDPDGLIGRDADIAWVVARIERGEPLVVVSGPAGVGKTSLATRLARIVERPGRHVIRKKEKNGETRNKNNTK